MKTKKEILSSKREIKHCYIIYALISNNEIVYIGQSTNILNRLSTHLSSFKEFDSWTIIENLGDFTTSKEVNRLEEKYIRKFLPKYNKIHNKMYQKKVCNKNQIDTLHWYDKKIYNHIQNGETIKSLSDKTNISYTSIYNTYTRVKKYLQEYAEIEKKYRIKKLWLRSQTGIVSRKKNKYKLK